MNRLWLKVKDSIFSVAPIAVIVLIIQFFIVPMSSGLLLLFSIGSLLLIIGMALFTLGADLSLMPMGDHVGSRMTKTNKRWLLLSVFFLLGFMITIAEPSLQVLAHQVPSVPNVVLILAVALGVAIFMAIAAARILLKIKISYLFMGFYALVFAVAIFTDKDYFAVAFDSGGVATGAINVPFILALGAGLSAVLGGKSSQDNSFGFVGLSCIGPIAAVMITGLFFDSSSSSHAPDIIFDVKDLSNLIELFNHNLLKYAREVGIALVPIILFFLIFKFIALEISNAHLIKIGIGLIYTYVGLVLFLTGVNVGFMPAGNYIGNAIGSLPNSWIIIPIGALMGFFVVAAEPAVHILNGQINHITGGAISKRVMMASFSIGVGASLGLAMFRIYFGVDMWYILVPCYVIALTLTLFTPEMFVAMAFDSGGVASGPMAATFLLPFALGATSALGGNVLTDAFGIVAMVTMTPFITVQVLGIIYKIKLRRTQIEEGIALDLDEEANGEDILEFEDGQQDTEGVE